jgi:hypothetical protein
MIDLVLGQYRPQGLSCKRISANTFYLVLREPAFAPGALRPASHAGLPTEALAKVGSLNSAFGPVAQLVRAHA